VEHLLHMPARMLNAISRVLLLGVSCVWLAGCVTAAESDEPVEAVTTQALSCISQLNQPLPSVKSCKVNGLDGIKDCSRTCDIERDWLFPQGGPCIESLSNCTPLVCGPCMVF
jgi:hypothetical protein